MSVLLVLAPALALAVLLCSRRYPGEAAILSARCRLLARHRRLPASSRAPRTQRVRRRADSVLALALAGRAPPAVGARQNRHDLTGGKMRSTATKIAALASTAALLAPAAAQAHISLHPNTIPAGAFATLDVRMPGEQEGAHVTKLDMLLPPGFTSVGVQNVPGWSVQVTNQKVSPPIQTDEGPVSEEVSHVVWTWQGPLGAVSNNQFIQFPLSVAIPANLTGQSLLFKTVQDYSNGQVVHWIEPSLTEEHPAARINVTAKGGAIEDVAGREAGPEAGQSGGSGGAAPKQVTLAGSSNGASKGLGVAALVVGALGLLAALGALTLGRRVRRGA